MSINPTMIMIEDEINVPIALSAFRDKSITIKKHNDKTDDNEGVLGDDYFVIY